MEPPPLPDKPSVGQILHIDQEDALRLTGSLMNEFTREIIQVFILKFKKGQVSTSGSTRIHPFKSKNWTSATKNDESAEKTA